MAGDLIVSAVRIDGTVETLDLAKRRADLEAYDRLGPLTRAVIDESPIDIEVRKMLVAFRERPRDIFAVEKPGYVPRSADEQMASFLADMIRLKVPTFKPIRRRGHGAQTLGSTAV